MSQPQISLDRMRELMAALPARIPTTLHAGDRVWHALIAQTPESPAGWHQGRFAGVRVVANHDLAPGQWRMLDQYGNTMVEGNLFKQSS